jgi:hypothetical protein
MDRSYLPQVIMLFQLGQVGLETVKHAESPPISPNGPAIWGGCVTRRSIRAESWYPEYSGPQSCHGARRVWRSFCHHGTNFIEHYACRGTKLIDETELSKCNKCYKMGTGAVSRYKLTRSQKSVTVQD